MVAPVRSGSRTPGIASAGAWPSPRSVNASVLFFLPFNLTLRRNGAEIGGRMAQLVFDSKDNLVLLNLDYENGFNTLSRGLIFY